MSAGAGPGAPAGRWTLIWRCILAFGCAVVLATAPLPHTDADALLYGKIAKNALASGDWLTLRSDTSLADVPPVTIWLMALSLRLAGDTAAALRLWHLLMTLALGWVTYRIARLGAGEEEALLAALLLLTTQQLLVWSLAPKQDIPLTLFLSLALYAYLLYRGAGRTSAAAATGLWLALAVLTKGPAALGVFALIVGIDLWLARGRASEAYWRWPQAAVGGAVFLLAAAPWFLYGSLHNGAVFVGLLLLQQSTAWRFVHGYAVPLPYGIGLIAYVPLLVAAALPWSGLLPGAIREGWRSFRGGSPPLRLSVVWALVVFGVLSLVPGTKSIRYLLPIYPPLAILSARFVRKAVEEPRGLYVPAAVLGGLWGIVLVAAAVAAAGRGLPEAGVYLPLAAVFTAAVAVFVLEARSGRGRSAVAVLAVGAFVTYGLFAWTFTRQFVSRWPLPSIAAQINRLYRPGDQVLNVGNEPLATGIVNYYLNGPTMMSTDEGALRRAWERGGVLAFLGPAVYRNVQRDLHPVTLMETPAGWLLVTNRPRPR
jgi:4-amino-4-deoxy-L-arabinose transferase-like glycosyltransferase